MEVFSITENLLGFYAGRDKCAANGAGTRPAQKDWAQFDLDLGVCAYAFHHENRAIVFDTLVSPEHGRLLRAYLEEDAGIRHITVIFSHWHLDHVAGAAAFQGCPIVASEPTRRMLAHNRAAIEAGSLWGPPPLKPVTLPDTTWLARAPLTLGDLELELIPWDIHTPGSLALYSGKGRILLAGDMLEDNIPCLNHPEAAHTYLIDLKNMANMDLAAIYPGHGCPEKIKQGGYGQDLIAATDAYIRHVLQLCRKENDAVMAVDVDASAAPLKDWVAPWQARGTLRYHPVYEGVHQDNMQRLREYYRDKPLPEVEPIS